MLQWRGSIILHKSNAKNEKIWGLDLNLLNYLQHENSTTYKFDVKKFQVLGAMLILKKASLLILMIL